MNRKKRAGAGMAVLLCLFAAAPAFAGGTTEAGKGPVVGLSNGPFADPWRVQMIESLHQQAETYIARGWMSRLIVENAGDDANLQAQQVRSLVAARANLILIDPISPSALAPVIREAEEAGALCILFDQQVSDPPCLNVAMNQDARMGALVDWLAKELGGRGNIVYLSGAADQPGTALRDQAVDAALSKYPALRVLARANGNGDEAVAQQKMGDFLATYPNIDGVLAQDGMSLGVVRAFDAAGRKVLPLTGDTRVAFIREWKKRRDAGSGFSSLVVEDSPGAVCTSLGIGLRLVKGKKLKPASLSAPNLLLAAPALTVDARTLDAVAAANRDAVDSFRLNTWYPESAIDALFQ
jgi:ribose transport system substrate-binding protein